MKKLFGVLLALMLTFSLASCGGGGGGADSPYAGRWTAVMGEVFGLAMTGDDMSGFEMDLTGDGKGAMIIDGESYKVKWSADGNKITIDIGGGKIEGELGEDTIFVEDMLGMGMSITFAKDGTAAADPALYLPKEEKALLGQWQSYAVVDILEEPIEGFPGDSLVLEFAGDHTVSLTLDGEDFGTHNWSLLGSWGSFDESELDISFEVDGDEIIINWIEDGEYFIFHCEKI